MTSAGVMDCKRALEATDGDIKKAIAYLGEQGIAAAAKRSERETGQGLIESYIHHSGRVGVLVELNCETDFVARTDDFKTLAHDIACRSPACRGPSCVSEDQLPADHSRCTGEEAVPAQAGLDP